LQRQYAELSATLTPEHYKVQRVQAQIAELQSNMLQERSQTSSAASATNTQPRSVGKNY